jgi:Uncharacterized conserved protein
METMLRIGTCSFTAPGWERAFYPPGLPASEQLSYYATQFDTLEIDSTFYRSPSRSTVENWARRTPAGFTFALKMPRAITHDKVLVECDAGLAQFLSVAEALREKLGPILIQFPYFNKSVFDGPQAFVQRLGPFLQALPSGFRFAVEIRNQWWLPAVRSLLADHGVPLALIDHPWMPRPSELERRVDPVTGPFTYVRLLGDRKGIEEQTKVFEKVVVDRRREIDEWVSLCRRLRHRGVDLYVYINNHYSGFAPANIRDFVDAWNRSVPDDEPF